jgi:hypothetical protein
MRAAMLFRVAEIFSPSDDASSIALKSGLLR